MAKIYVSLPDKLEADAKAAAKASYKTLSAFIRDAVATSIPKQPTAKQSVAEQKAEAYAARKAKMQDKFRTWLADGWTVQGILTACLSWRKEAAQWLGEITTVLPTDMPLAGASEAEAQAILDERKRELHESLIED